MNTEILVWAQGMTAVYTAFAATLEPNITGMVLVRPLLTCEEIVTRKAPTYKHEVIIPGILEKLDLPEVYQALCPTRVVLVDPRAGDKSSVLKRKADEAYQQIANSQTPAKVVQKLARHSDPRLTFNTYARTFERAERKAMNFLPDFGNFVLSTCLDKICTRQEISVDSRR